MKKCLANHLHPHVRYPDTGVGGDSLLSEHPWEAESEILTWVEFCIRNGKEVATQWQERKEMTRNCGVYTNMPISNVKIAAVYLVVWKQLFFTSFGSRIVIKRLWIRLVDFKFEWIGPQLVGDLVLLEPLHPQWTSLHRRHKPQPRRRWQ